MEAYESLYVILGVEEDATPQQIKTAYKKAALKTHPDRALPERKAEAETNFKRIAEAYEVLSKPDTRQRYDMYGTATSPPPYTKRTPKAGGSSSNSSNTYFGTSPDSQPFTFQWESAHDSARRAQAQRGNGSRRPFGGVDPFELFNQMFASEMRGTGLGGHGGHGIFDNHPFFASHRQMGPSGFGTFSELDDMFGAPGQGADAVAPARRGMGDEMGMGMGMGMGGMNNPFGGFASTMGGGGFGSGMMMSSSSSSSSSGMGLGGVSESRQTRTINGRTETIVRRVDAQGNETVHTITPDRQHVTVNGVEQPNHPLLQGAPDNGNTGRVGRGFLPF